VKKAGGSILYAGGSVIMIVGVL